MATVRWINIQTGEVKWGAEDLYRKGESPWAPSCRVKLPDGSIRENTLNSFYLWIDRNFAMINLDNTKSIGMISISGVTMDVAQKELFYTGVNLYSYLMAEPSFPVIQVTYKPSPVTNWPDRNTWIEALKTDDDTTEETNKKIEEMSEKIDHLTQLLIHVISNKQLSEENNMPNIIVSSEVNSRRESLVSIPEEEEKDLLYRLLNPQVEDLFIE